MARPSRDRPKVVFVIGGLERGGSESQLVALVEAIHPERVDAVVATITGAHDPELKRRLEAAGVPIATLGSRGREVVGRMRAAVEHARMTVELIRLIRRFRPDVAYPWLEEAAFLTTPVARGLGVPCLIARRNVSGGYADRPALLQRAIFRAERLAALATANSDAVAEETVRRGWSRDRVRLVPNGHADPGELPAPDDAVVELGYLARFRSEKGHMRALAVAARLNTLRPWRLTLAGDGPLLDAVRAEVTRLGLAQQVVFGGFVNDPYEFWARSHVALLLSDHEGSPNALIEAALIGRPLVGTKVGGIPALVGTDAGFVLDPEDVEGITAATRALVDDPALRARLGAAARKRALHEFSRDAFVEGHLAAIEAVRWGDAGLVASAE